MVNEIWRDIKGYEGLYQVSNLGNVKSLPRQGAKGKILKQCKLSNGYLYVNLYKNGNFKHYLVHRLVAEHFIDNSQNKPEIDHINTITTDNRVENLRWCSHKENSNNPFTIDKLNKPIIQFSKDGEFIRKWNCIIDVQRELGIHQTNISKCCKGKLKSVGGYIWHYYYKGIWLKNHIPQKDKIMSA